MTNEELAVRIRSGEKEYALQLWKQTERFIGKQARQYMANLITPRGIDVEDLKQAGYLAMIDAAEHYDPDGGASFLHFLTFHLHHHFTMAAGLQSDRSKGDPINTEISLDRQLREGKPETLADLQTTNDDALEAAEKRIYNVELRAALENALDQIRPEDARTIRARFFDEKTLAETAEESGVSTERIRQRERHGLRDLERKARAKKNSLLAYIELRTDYYHRTNYQHTLTSPVEALAIYREQLQSIYERMTAQNAARRAERRQGEE